MSRKDYIALAAVFAWHQGSPSTTPEQWDTGRLLAHSFADVLQADNARFDRRRFLDACGVT